MEITGIKAIRIVTTDPQEFEKTRDFYRGLLGKREKLAFGGPKDVHQGAFFEVGGIDLVVTREADVTPEAKIKQGPAWICFKTDEPESTLSQARDRGTSLPNEVVNTSFGTQGFFVNDPTGLAVYVGTPWQS